LQFLDHSKSLRIQQEWKRRVGNVAIGAIPEERNPDEDCPEKKHVVRKQGLTADATPGQLKEKNELKPRQNGWNRHKSGALEKQSYNRYPWKPNKHADGEHSENTETNQQRYGTLRPEIRKRCKQQEIGYSESQSKRVSSEARLRTRVWTECMLIRRKRDFSIRRRVYFLIC